MKRPVLFFFVVAFNFAIQAQDTAKWMRVQSDDGVFSVEVPGEHTYFFDKEGFSLTGSSNDYELRDVSLLNAYSNGTLLTVEAYRSRGGALDALFQGNMPRSASGQSITFNGLNGKRFENRTDSSYLVSYYVRSKEWIYIVSSASRTGETLDMKRFLESIRIDTKATGPVDTVIKFSSLERATVDLKTKKVKTPTARTPGGTKTEPDPSVKPVLILIKPRASYTDTARQKGVTGTVRLRLKLSEKGSIPDIEVIESLGGGLARQSLFAALRMKFLPKEKDGRPVSSTVTLEYTFSIY